MHSYVQRVRFKHTIVSKTLRKVKSEKHSVQTVTTYCSTSSSYNSVYFLKYIVQDDDSYVDKKDRHLFI